jgi:hypothetical protein
MGTDVAIHSYEIQMSVETPARNFTKRCQYLHVSHVDLPANFTQQGLQIRCVLCDEEAPFTFPASHSYTVHALM